MESKNNDLIMDDLVFHIVPMNGVPAAFEIWNIGKNMPDGYIPFCRLAMHQPFSGARNIDTNCLFAVRFEQAQEVLALAGKGLNTIAKMEAFLQKNKSAKAETEAFELMARIRSILPALKSSINTEK